MIFDEGLHELVCRACGAPLHELKSFPLPSDKVTKKSGKKRKAEKHKPRRNTNPEPYKHEWRDGLSRRRRKPKRRPVISKVFEEIWDVVEDILD
ncbi:MAG: hypothetical protein AAF922_18200 [Pseudomonadota bacterium]